jgi:eukaryotic-like serine/threonine-protein kinase
METALCSPDELPIHGTVELAPRTLGAYELIEELGRGGMGVIYRARQIRLRREVALKLINGIAFASNDTLRRFKAEAEVAASLDHPNIVPIHEIGEHDSQPFFSMGLVSGPALDKKLAGQPIEPETAARLVIKIARAVQYAHDRGILHRDLKPANILLDAQDEPHLSDFGIARVMQNESTLTGTHAILGTPSYMAPEQARGDVKNFTVAVDIYGVGAVLYHLLTGVPPFAGGTTFETVRQVLESEPRRPTLLNPKVDRDLETICLKCLDKSPAGRYPSAAAIAEDLERWLCGKPVLARPISTGERAFKLARRHPLVTALSLLALSALVGGASGIFWQWRRAEQKSLEATQAQERAEREQYFSSITAAQKFLKDGAVDKARELLLSTRLESRHWEWGRLILLCQQEAMTLPAPHQRVDPNRAILSMSPLTRRWLTTYGGVATMLDSRLGWRELSSPNDRILSATFSPDEKLIAGVTAEGAMVLWDATTLNVRHRFHWPEWSVSSCAFSPDSLRLTAGTREGRVLMFDIGNPSALLSWPLDSELAPVFSHDGKRVLSALNANQIVAWDSATGAEIWRERIDSPEMRVLAAIDGRTRAILSLRSGVKLKSPSGKESILASERRLSRAYLSPNGTRLFTIDDREWLTLWNTETGQEIDTWPERTYVIFQSDDSRYFASFGGDRFVKVRLCESGRELLTAGVPPEIPNLFFTPDGQFLAAEMPDRSIKIWLLEDAATFLTYKDPEKTRNAFERFQKIAFSPKGDRIAGAHEDRTVSIWDTASGALVRRLHGHMHWVADVAWSPNGQWIASAAGDNRVILWESESGKAKFILAAHTAPAESVSFSPDSRQLVSCGMDGRLVFWDVESGKMLREVPLSGVAKTIDWSRDGRSIAVGTMDQVFLILDQKPLTLPIPSVVSVRFDPTSQMLAVGSSDQSISLWSVPELSLIKTLRSRAMPLDIDFSPDGVRLAVACSERNTGLGFPSLDVWAVSEGRLAAEFPADPGQALAVAFSPDGHTLALGHSRGTLELFNAFPWHASAYGTFKSSQAAVESFQQKYWSNRLDQTHSRWRQSEARSWIAPRTYWPNRPADAPATALDLTPFYNGLLEVAWAPVPSRDLLSQNFSALTAGLQTYSGLQFDVRGVIQLASDSPRWKALFPTRVTGIPLLPTFRKIHLLHGALGPPGHESKIGECRIVFADDSAISFPFELGVNVLPSWIATREEMMTVPGAKLVWNQAKGIGYSPTAASTRQSFGALYHLEFVNPHPEKQARTLELISNETTAAPFIVAVSIEE